MPKRIL